ncbi:MAG: TolC family protein [Acidobacteria bacterium]|nr:TolC family protein [Acidobacteriota bacterium]
MKTDRKPLSGMFWIAAVLLASVPLLPANPLPGEDAGVLTLEQAIAQAIANNREVRISGLEAEKAHEKTQAFRTHFFPTINFRATGSQQLAPIEFFFRQGVFGEIDGRPVPSEDTYLSTARVPTLVLQADVQQPLTQLYRLKLNVKALRKGEEIARQDVRLKTQDLVKSTKLAYWGIAQAQSGIRALEETLRLYRELDRLTQDYLAQEVVLKADALQVQAALAKTEYDLQCLRDTQATGKEQLNLLLGRDPMTPFSVEEAPAPTTFETDPEAARRTALEQRAEVAKAKLQIEQAELDRRAKKAEYIPDLGVGLQAMRLINYDEMLPKNMIGLGLVFSWEIWDWGRKKRELGEKDRTISQARLALRETSDTVVVDVNDKFRKVRQNRLLLESARLARETAAENLRVVSNRYKVEAALLKDTLQAQSDLENANNAWRDAVIAFWTARAEFEKALGEEK